MSVFEHPEFDHHEEVVFCHDAEAGLFGIIAVHSHGARPRGRWMPHVSLRLDRRRAHRRAAPVARDELQDSAAGLPLGGGKCVIVADPTRPDKADLLRAMAEARPDARRPLLDGDRRG